ncbi:MAG: M14 family metallopeptidase [Bacteroidia bacterium]|nr:M14 family metallopeptidase [Bacteroidia bacterium]
MRCLLALFVLLPALGVAQTLQTPYEASGGTQTATYAESIAWYQALAAAHPNRVVLTEIGMTDVGQPLHLVVVSNDGIAAPDDPRLRGRTVFLVNNGIHPGEPEGIDASMLLARDLAQGKHPEWLAQTVLLIVPVFNVGGALNRGPYSRANQNGPAAYGFRGNARNLDLNRDFIKQDSRNAQSLIYGGFTQWRPHLFLDNHTTNGADYPPAMTLIHSQRSKLAPALRSWFVDTLVAQLYARHEALGHPLNPYYNPRYDQAEGGIVEFNDSPRYSTGFAALQNCPGLVAEAHMLKPFAERVAATRRLMEVLLEVLAQQGPRLRAMREAVDAERPTRHVVAWALDTTRVDSIRFYGYPARQKPSAIHGQPRTYYDRAAPWARSVPYWAHYRPTAEVAVPQAYIIPQAWGEVIERLWRSGVGLQRLKTDTTLEVTVYYLRQYQTAQRPYEGHYLHYSAQPEPKTERLTYRAGDYLAYTDQPTWRVLVETLEPQGPDSYFSWGFFDSILQQKEYFSDYLWEDTAADLLATDPDLRRRFEAAKAADSTLAQTPRAQLNWLYRNSPYYEPTAYRYPIGRLERKP